MKYFISIIILSLVLFSCSKKDDDSSTTTTELEGTWVESCHNDVKWTPSQGQFLS